MTLFLLCADVSPCAVPVALCLAILLVWSKK